MKNLFLLSLFILIAGSTLATAIPELPMIVNGEIYINDKPAEIGTGVKAILGEDVVSEFEVAERGRFNLLLQKLDKGDEVEFFVDDIWANQSVIYQSGDFKQLTLKVEKSYLVYYFSGVIILLIIGFVMWKRKK